MDFNYDAKGIFFSPFGGGSQGVAGHLFLLQCWHNLLWNIANMPDHIQEVGTAVAFDCSERDSVFSEVEKVEKWKQHCINIMGTSVGAQTSLLRELHKVRWKFPL